MTDAPKEWITESVQGPAVYMSKCYGVIWYRVVGAGCTARYPVEPEWTFCRFTTTAEVLAIDLNDPRIIDGEYAFEAYSLTDGLHAVSRDEWLWLALETLSPVVAGEPLCRH